MEQVTIIDRKKRLYRITAVAVLVLSIALISSYYQETQKLHSTTMKLATNTARSNFEKDLAFREWVARHGGLYVPENQRTPENPYLSNVDDQNIQTPAGVNLTLMNPAYALRQLIEEYEARMGIIGHITSLKPINPDNAADEWETEALKGFEKDIDEVSEVSEINGETYLRLIKPMYTQEACLKCHADQGYDVGDIRGGISIAVPITQYLRDESEIQVLNTRNHGILWSLGIVGIFLGTRQIGNDIDEVVRAERLEEQNAHLKRLDELKTRFISIATHEIRTPLTSIKGYTELISSRIAEPDSKEFWSFIEIIEKNVERLELLTIDLLDMQRITEGRLVVNLDSVPLDSLIHDVKNEIVPLLAQRTQKLVIEGHGDDILLNCDRMRLVQVFINLISNASKFSPPGSDILLEYSKDGPEVVFSITDKGIGMDSEDISKLFTPFPEITVDANIESTGLGLSISKGIIESHNGTIWAESKGKDQGCTFSFTVPSIDPSSPN